MKKAHNGPFFILSMKIQKLEDCFFAENSHLVEVLDKQKDSWVDKLTKQRGYGIVLLELNGLRFGIPLRSHISHRYCFKTNDTKGLDYSKAVLLTKDSYISEQPFIIPPDEYVMIVDREHYIKHMFAKYVNKYIDGVNKKDSNVLRMYAFSTLKNYHVELGLM